MLERYPRTLYLHVVTETKYRQIVYHSVAVAGVDTAEILQQSRHNNALDGVTGVLWSDGKMFLQVVEGPDHSVAAAFIRIAADPRHSDIAILSDRLVAEREFGYWSMETGRASATGDEAAARLRRRIGNLPAELQALFAT